MQLREAHASALFVPAVKIPCHPHPLAPWQRRPAERRPRRGVLRSRWGDAIKEARALVPSRREADVCGAGERMADSARWSEGELATVRRLGGSHAADTVRTR
ncbi:hypothetical protein JCM13580A_13040 [Streptomyces drozdowiczii]